MATVSLRQLRKSFGHTEVVHGIDLEVAHHEFVVLVGPSGCGKSTTLRMIAGLEDISGGEIWVGDTLVNELEPKDRDIAMVFQDYALYPHMSVYDNIAFSLQYRGVRKPEIRERVMAAAEILDISELLDRRPKQLSGGQRQRVAMGRCVVRDPKVFLFDEPLSNLDAKLRITMRSEIKKLHKRVGTTIIFVTHDQVEAMTLADRIVVMNEGNIEQIGTPDEVYRQPASMFVAGFIGSPTMNFLPATLVDNGSGVAARVGDTFAVPLAADASGLTGLDNGAVMLGIRPEAFAWAGEGDMAALFDTVATEVEPLGSDTLVFFQLHGHELVCRLPPRFVSRAGDPVRLQLDPGEAHLFHPQSGLAL